MKIQTPKHNWQRYKFGSISLCMIMRNEAKLLPRCLNSVRGLVDEIIIVDTGSTDNSIAIAKSFGATVLHDPWQDDFARPRNIGIAQARCDYILIMDPDEVISQKDHINVKWLTRKLAASAFWITTLNYGPHIHEPNYRYCPTGKDPMNLYPGYTPSTKTRFFKNGLGIVFEGCWHELVDYYCIRNKIQIAKTTIPIHHWNHEINQKTPWEKRKLYLRLGEKKVRDWPTHGQAHWELAVAELIHGYHARALNTIKKAISLGFAGPAQWFALSRCYRALSQKENMDFAFEKGVCGTFKALTHIDTDKKNNAFKI